MLKNYFKIAWRNFYRDRSFTFLNLIGLSTGLACTLLICLWVNDELGVDHFYEKDSRLFQVLVNTKNANDIQTIPETPALLAGALAADMPEVEYAASEQGSFSGQYTLSAGAKTPETGKMPAGEKTLKATGLYVSKDYFHVFSWPLLEGNKDQVLADKNSIVLSKALALRLFGTAENIVGRKVSWQHEKQFVVSGIVDASSVHSSTQFDFLMPFELFLEANPDEKDWKNSDPRTYVVLKEGARVEAFNKKMTELVKSKNKSSSPLFLRRYSDGYLYGRYENGVQAGGRIEYVRLFSIIALFILVIACINFMNLSTARASKRMKEVGIRKCVGASRLMLVFQYLGEAMLMAFISLAVALLFVGVLLPFFNAFVGKRLALSGGRELLFLFGGITLFAGFLAGSYPAIYLSGFKPVAVLKGKLRDAAGEIWVRKGLVVFQFTLSVVLIIAVMVVYRQIAYIQQQDRGFNKDNVVSFNVEGAVTPANMSQFLEGIETFIAQVKTLPGVANVSSMDHNSIVSDFGSTGDIKWAGKGPGQNISFGNIGINYGLIETLGMQMAAGRSFSRALSSDSSEIIFNEAAIRAMGIKDPVGKTVTMWGQDRRIAGVVKDFHYQSFHTSIKPFAFRLEPLFTNRIFVKIKPGAVSSVLGRLQELFLQRYPGFVFDYQFLDQDYQAQYIAEKQVAGLSLWFTGLTILISCLGLFGLAAFTAERRFKEIGIRKVLGATAGSVVVLLSGDFLKLVLIALLAGFPLAWWAANQWLDGFVYHTQIGVGIFLMAGVSIVVITLLTIGYQAVKAALANPAKSLATE
jgi:predicted permease